MLTEKARTPRVDRLLLVMGLAIAGTVVAGFVATAYLFARHHANHLLEEARVSAVSQAEVLRAVLEHQMREKDRTLIADLVKAVAKDPAIRQVLVVNRYGQLRYSSGTHPSPDETSLSSPTCQACHRSPPQERVRSRVVALADGEVLRTVTPIRNRVECFSCHGSDSRTNGVLIVDIDARRIPAQARRDAQAMAIWGGGVVLAVLLVLGVVLRTTLIRRLRLLQAFGARLASGETELRMPVRGADALSFIAESFNSLAEAISRLVGQVREERAHLERILNSIPDGIVVLGPDQRIVAANDAFLQRAGVRREAFVGCSCLDLAGLGCGPERCPARAVLTGTSREETRVLEIAGPDGSVRHEEVRASAVQVLGQTHYVVEVWRDITRRRLEEARLAESYRLASLGMLASGFSHEVNTPLATALACIEGMMGHLEEASALDPNFLRESASIAREQVLRCRAISSQFLRLARGGPGARTLCDLVAVAESAVRLARPVAREAGVRLVVERAGDPHLVRAGEGAVQLVLLNLLVNAVEASQRGGQVEIAVRKVEGKVWVEVRDHGQGIAAQDLPRVFEPFFTTKERGTGLGLFLAREFAREWGGDIEVLTRPGEGATFRVTFPPAEALDQGEG